MSSTSDIWPTLFTKRYQSILRKKFQISFAGSALSVSFVEAKSKHLNLFH